jgi:hypothetical protein
MCVSSLCSLSFQVPRDIDTHIHTYTHTHIHTYTHTPTHTHTHTHTHTEQHTSTCITPFTSVYCSGLVIVCLFVVCGLFSLPTMKFQVGDEVSIAGGKYNGRRARVLRNTARMSYLSLLSPARAPTSGAPLRLRHSSLVLLSSVLSSTPSAELSSSTSAPIFPPTPLPTPTPTPLTKPSRVSHSSSEFTSSSHRFVFCSPPLKAVSRRSSSPSGSASPSSTSSSPYSVRVLLPSLPPTLKLQPFPTKVRV